MAIQADGSAAFLKTAGDPQVQSTSPEELTIRQPLAQGGRFEIICQPDQLICQAWDNSGQPLAWVWRWLPGRAENFPVKRVTSGELAYSYKGNDFVITIPTGQGRFQGSPSGPIQMLPNATGRLVLPLRELHPGQTNFN